MDLKKFLKTIKLHEREISILVGVLLILLVGIFVVRYVRNLRNALQNQETSTKPNNGITHTVSKGETLWSISQEYFQNGTLWRKIADANNITAPTKIKVGQVLTIPSISEESTLAPTQTKEENAQQKISPQITEEAASTTSEITGDNYTVERGDNLWKIAVRAYGNGYKWVEIARANKLHNPNLIHKGNVFVIPR